MAIHLCFESSNENLVTTSRLRLRAVNQTTECRRNENHSINSPRLMDHTHHLYKQKILDYSHNTVPLHRYLLYHIHFYLKRIKYINQNNMHPVGCQNSKVTTEYACYGFEFAELRLFSRSSPRYLCFPALGLRCTLSHLYAQFQSLFLTTYVTPAYPFPHFSLPVSFPALGMRCLWSNACY